MIYEKSQLEKTLNIIERTRVERNENENHLGVGEWFSLMVAWRYFDGFYKWPWKLTRPIGLRMNELMARFHYPFVRQKVNLSKETKRSFHPLKQFQIAAEFNILHPFHLLLQLHHRCIAFFPMTNLIWAWKKTSTYIFDTFQIKLKVILCTRVGRI